VGPGEPGEDPVRFLYDPGCPAGLFVDSACLCEIVHLVHNREPTDAYPWAARGSVEVTSVLLRGAAELGIVPSDLMVILSTIELAGGDPSGYSALVEAPSSASLCAS
jgi:hypothetical protein